MSQLMVTRCQVDMNLSTAGLTNTLLAHCVALSASTTVIGIGGQQIGD